MINAGIDLNPLLIRVGSHDSDSDSVAIRCIIFEGFNCANLLWTYISRGSILFDLLECFISFLDARKAGSSGYLLLYNYNKSSIFSVKLSHEITIMNKIRPHYGDLGEMRIVNSSEEIVLLNRSW